MVAVSAIVGRNGDAHFLGDLSVMLLMASNAAQGVNVFEKDRVLWVFKFTNGMGIAEIVEVLPMTIVTG